MADNSLHEVRETLDAVYRAESRRILATLIRLLGDFDAAEEALQEAFTAAAERWDAEGVPANPRAWLISTGRFKAIDKLRRELRFDSDSGGMADRVAAENPDPGEEIDKRINDDELRLIFTCCHPALPPEAQIALTLREVCGLTTEEIARSFLTSAPTIAQRIVRAKVKIREGRIPYEVPPAKEFPERLDAVLHVIYLVFNEGYSPTSGEAVTREELSLEAIRLGRLLLEILPDPEVMGLLALMLLQESRRAARTSAKGEMMLLGDQDRRLWDPEKIKEGVGLVSRAFAQRRFGTYTLQAAIAATHSRAQSETETDWKEIVGLYNLLLRIVPSPVVRLNRAVAVAMMDGPAEGLAIVDSLVAEGELADYHLLYSIKGELCRRLGRKEEAIEAYKKSLALTNLGPERRFIEKKIKELG
ncbi:MAG TPA: RNA polymerase sigma factor [Bacteroidota bacterium]|nr:RNA polymerase sigma factor [Bacteroidota bacterium]